MRGDLGPRLSDAHLDESRLPVAHGERSFFFELGYDLYEKRRNRTTREANGSISPLLSPVAFIASPLLSIKGDGSSRPWRPDRCLALAFLTDSRRLSIHSTRRGRHYKLELLDNHQEMDPHVLWR